MNTTEILEAIDQEIFKLQQARTLLAEVPTILATKRRGITRSSATSKAEVAAPVASKKARRTLSAEGKARIAAAQKARWAAQKKASKPAKSAAKKIAAKPARKAVPAKPAAKKIAAKVSRKAVVPANKPAAEPVANA